MLIDKITHGFVIQTYDTESKKFVLQEFVAGDQVEYESKDGDPVECPDSAPYLPFFMKQPVEIDPKDVQALTSETLQKLSLAVFDLRQKVDAMQGAQALQCRMEEAERHIRSLDLFRTLIQKRMSKQEESSAALNRDVSHAFKRVSDILSAF